MDEEQSGGKSSEEVNKDKPRVPDVIRQYQVYFVHGIHPEFSPGGNTLLNPKVGWNRKLDIVMAMQPTLSASTIKDGDYLENLWSRMGVVLSDGVIEKAYSADGATMSVNLKQRQFTLPEEGESSIVAAVNRSGPKTVTGIRKYNEYVISNSGVAGFYVCMDEPDNNGRRDLVPFKEIEEGVLKYNIPLFVMYRRVLYKPGEGEADAEKMDKVRKIIGKADINLPVRDLSEVGWRRVKPEEIALQRVQISDEMREKTIREVLDNNTFNLIRLAESNHLVDNLVSLGQGREAYLKLSDRNKFADRGTEKTWWSEPDKTVKEIDCFYIGYIRHKFGFRNGKLVHEDTDEATGNGGAEEVNRRRNDWYIQIGANTLKMPEQLSDTDAYLRGMEKVLGQRVEKWREEEKSGTAEESEWCKEVLDRLIYHLYGFGLQAKRLGDEGAGQKAAEMIGRITDYAEIERLVKEKTDQNGKIRLTMEDLGS